MSINGATRVTMVRLMVNGRTEYFDIPEAKFDRRVASRFFRNSTHVDLSDVPDFSTK